MVSRDEDLSHAMTAMYWSRYRTAAYHVCQTGHILSARELTSLLPRSIAVTSLRLAMVLANLEMASKKARRTMTRTCFGRSDDRSCCLNG